MGAEAEKERIARGTIRLELCRAVASGVLDTVLSTFAILLLVKVYAAGADAKAVVLSAARAGLLGGVPLVAILLRRGASPARAAAVFHVAAGCCFLIPVFAPGSLACFVIGIAGAFLLLAMLPTLQTQIYRSNYPSAQRGRLFSLTIIVRSAAAMLFSKLAGDFLDLRLSSFHVVLVAFALMCFWSAVCFRLLPGPATAPRKTGPGSARLVLGSLFGAFAWLKRDLRLRWVLLAWMLLGTGMMMAWSLQVDYLANPRHGLNYSPRKVALVAGVIPVACQLVTTYFWGWLFDRMQFPLFRISINVLLAAAVLVFYLSGGLTGICIGMGLFGVARGGGNVAWSLWVTKLARSSHRVAEYMSLHAFFTGVRGLVAPWIAFALAGEFGVGIFAGICAALLLISCFFLLPLARKGSFRDGETEDAAQR